MNVKTKNKFISGPLSDWSVPLKHNFWFQLGIFFTVTGVTLIVFGIFLSLPAALIGIYLFVIGLVTLGATLFGRGTITSYRRTKAHIGTYKHIEPWFLDGYTRSMYCSRVGVWVAAKELECTHQLTGRLTSPSPIKIC